MTRGALTPGALTPGAPRKCKGYKRKKFSTSVVAKKKKKIKRKRSFIIQRRARRHDVYLETMCFGRIAENIDHAIPP